MEILNGIESLLKEKRFDQAISDLNYLLRTAPTRDQEIRYKLARIYLSRNDPTQALISLSPLLPSSNKDIT
ncbi:MAG: tetratricopeptide repeat protein, partial [Candidatus Hodarchaeales archaeon]